MTTLLEATALTVSAGGKRIVDRVSLLLRSGETVAVIGPNGAGKSTLLRALAGERPLRGGSVTLRDRDLSSFGPRHLAQHRAVLSQSVTVAFPFTVGEIVAMGAGGRHGREIEALVAVALSEVDLADFHERAFPTLSGGEQQRAHFARVLVQFACGEALNGPGLLLLDEPTASLDLKHQLALARSAQRCAERGGAVLAVLHDLNLAALFADRIVVMEGGRIVAEGAPRQVITDALLDRVFGVRDAVGRVPARGLPFVLLQSAKPAAA